MAFNKSEYDQKYNRENIKRKFIPFNIQNPEDLKLLEWLKGKNVTAYVKELIRADMERCVSDGQNI